MVCAKRWCIVLAAVLLFACAGQEKKASEKPSQPVNPAEVEAIQRIPNPYLAQDQKVPGEAVTEFNAALAAIKASDWPQAQKRLQAMTQTYPELSGPWVNLGIVYWRQEKYNEAENAFTQATQINALNNDAYVQFAVMQRERGKFAEAEQLYLKALEVWPHNIDALINLGILYDMYMGRFDDALKQFELAQKLVSEPNQQLDGWIIDLKRRQSE